MSGLSLVISLGLINQHSTKGVNRGDEIDHLVPAIAADAPVELVLVDSHWPKRWPRVEEALGPMLDRVLYIPPKPSIIRDHGYRTASNTRNSGAIASIGDLIMCVDDYLLLEPRALEIVWAAYEKEGVVVNPCMLPIAKDVQPFSGHNGGIYMATREQFAMTKGFDENFDGAYGEADTDWEWRYDALLRKLYGKSGRQMRQRRKGVRFLRTPHKNGAIAKPMGKTVSPWGTGSTDAWYMRCNRAYYKFVPQPRVNQVLTDKQIDSMRGRICLPHCGPCKRPDRENQLESYKTLVPDGRVAEKMAAFVKAVDSGELTLEPNMDPWSLFQLDEDSVNG